MWDRKQQLSIASKMTSAGNKGLSSANSPVAVLHFAGANGSPKNQRPSLDPQLISSGEKARTQMPSPSLTRWPLSSCPSVPPLSCSVSLFSAPMTHQRDLQHLPPTSTSPRKGLACSFPGRSQLSAELLLHIVPSVSSMGAPASTPSGTILKGDKKVVCVARFLETVPLARRNCSREERETKPKQELQTLPGLATK